jgi:hypothetical protein
MRKKTAAMLKIAWPGCFHASSAALMIWPVHSCTGGQLRARVAKRVDIWWRNV